MCDLESDMTVSSAKSSLDSGFDNGFLSDSSSSSSKSDRCSPTCPPECVFEAQDKVKRCSKQLHHHCILNSYCKSGWCIETLSARTFLYLANCVRVLDLSRNKIKTLPETISDLQHLQELNLSCNELLSVPDSCKRLQKLQVLNLSQNRLTEPPLCLELGMEGLTHLDLSRNMISTFSNQPKCSPLLQVLNLSYNCFNLIPLWLFSEHCRSIVELDISFNFCFDHPSLRSQILFLRHHRTSALKSLKKLKMCNSGVSQGIISPLSSFESLQRLHIGNLPGPESTFNHFSGFELSLLYNPSNIVELHLPKIGLAGLPEEIYKFQNLEYLDASHNPLDWLPETFGLLKSLRELIISDCNLSYLPNNFGQLKSLRKLVLDKNKLTDVRDSLSGLSGLELLDVYDNCLEELPVSLDVLNSLHMVDFAHNYFNLEVALDIEVNGEKLFDVYLLRQARLREANSSGHLRGVSFKVNSNIPSWESSESLYKSYRSNSYSDLSQHGDSTNLQFCSNEIEDVEENWDEDSSNENDEFEPDSVYRFHLPLGQYQFGWTPPVKRRECTIPISQQVSGFVFVPGQFHQKTTIKKRRKKVKDLPVCEGQFEDAEVEHIGGFPQGASLGEFLSKMFMFVRNPAGLRSKRRCKFHSVYEDCLHHGLWYGISPPVTFQIPEDFSEEDSDI